MALDLYIEGPPSRAIMIELGKSQFDSISSVGHIDLVAAIACPVALALVECAIACVANGACDVIGLAAHIAPRPGCIWLIRLPDATKGVHVGTVTGVDP